MSSHEVFIHIHQGCFAGTGAIVRLPQCQLSKPDGYGKISQCITTTKQKPCAYFLGYTVHCTNPLMAITRSSYRKAKHLVCPFMWYISNSLWLSEALWRHRFGSTLAQALTCRPTAQTITWTIVDLSSPRSIDIHMRAIPQEIPQFSIIKIHNYLYKSQFQSLRGHKLKSGLRKDDGLSTNLTVNKIFMYIQKVKIYISYEYYTG